MSLTWQESLVLATVAAGATIANAVSGFDPTAVYVGILGWGARSAGSPG